MAYLTTLAFLVLLGTSVTPAAAQSGSGTTTRYWYVSRTLDQCILTSPGTAANPPAHGPCPALHHL